jgi:hypothetical protein
MISWEKNDFILFITQCSIRIMLLAINRAFLKLAPKGARPARPRAGSYLGNASILRCHYHTLKVVGLSFAKFKSNVFWLTNFVNVLKTFAKIVIN